MIENNRNEAFDRFCAAMSPPLTSREKTIAAMAMGYAVAAQLAPAPATVPGAEFIGKRITVEGAASKAAGLWEEAHRELLDAIMACCDPELKVCGLRPGPEKVALEAVISRHHTIHSVEGPYIDALATPIQEPGVKALAWTVRDNDYDPSQSRGGLFQYEVQKDGEEPEAWSLRRDGKLILYAASRRGAEDAGDTDYKRLIRSALSPRDREVDAAGIDRALAAWFDEMPPIEEVEAIGGYQGVRLSELRERMRATVQAALAAKP